MESSLAPQNPKCGEATKQTEKPDLGPDVWMEFVRLLTTKGPHLTSFHNLQETVSKVIPTLRITCNIHTSIVLIRLCGDERGARIADFESPGPSISRSFRQGDFRCKIIRRWCKETSEGKRNHLQAPGQNIQERSPPLEGAGDGKNAIKIAKNSQPRYLAAFYFVNKYSDNKTGLLIKTKSKGGINHNIKNAGKHRKHPFSL